MDKKYFSIFFGTVFVVFILFTILLVHGFEMSVKWCAILGAIGVIVTIMNILALLLMKVAEMLCNRDRRKRDVIKDTYGMFHFEYIEEDDEEDEIE